MGPLSTGLRTPPPPVDGCDPAVDEPIDDAAQPESSPEEVRTLVAGVADGVEEKSDAEDGAVLESESSQSAEVSS